MTTARINTGLDDALHSAIENKGDLGKSKVIMRGFDQASAKIPIELTPADIKHLRESNNVSQAVFACYLNASRSTVRKWELGGKKPNGMALKLLSIVRDHGLQILM